MKSRRADRLPTGIVGGPAPLGLDDALGQGRHREVRGLARADVVEGPHRDHLLAVAQTAWATSASAASLQAAYGVSGAVGDSSSSGSRDGSVTAP